MTKLRVGMVIASLSFLWACGGSPEQAALDQFFRAAQANDSSTLAYMSAVGPPLEVESWKMSEVTSRTTEPFTLPEVLVKFEAAKAERDAAAEKRQKYGKDQEEALEQIIPKLRDDPEYKFKGKLGEIQEEWAKLLEERKEKEQVFQELKLVVNRESNIASKSVMRQVEVGKLTGDVEVTNVLFNIKPKGGGELPFKATLRKYNLTDPEVARVEPARWVITDIEGATEEAKAAVAAARPAKATRAAAESSAEGGPSTAAGSADAASSQQPAGRDQEYIPRELRGSARVQILAPETKVDGDEVVSTIRARNVSRDWITGFMVTEHWYDRQGTAVRSSSRTHRERFMPGEVLELELRTRKGADFYQSQYEFSHANGDVTATTVGSFPSQTSQTQ
jgi:hypothetical protein